MRLGFICVYIIVCVVLLVFNLFIIVSAYGVSGNAVSRILRVKSEM